MVLVYRLRRSTPSPQRLLRRKRQSRENQNDLLKEYPIGAARFYPLLAPQIISWNLWRAGISLSWHVSYLPS
jgi:hypothetical protein